MFPQCRILPGIRRSPKFSFLNPPPVEKILALNPPCARREAAQVYIIRNYVTVSAGDIGAIYGLTPLNRLSAEPLIRIAVKKRGQKPYF